MFIHIYKNAAALDDPSYRLLLQEHASCSSAAAKSFTQAGFERVMAALETVLFTRVDTGRVGDPVGRSKYIKARSHWRDRLPEDGFINSRQVRKIEDLWSALCATLPKSKRNLDYLARIVAKSTGKEHVGAGALTTNEAAHLIDALQDRTNYATVSEGDDDVPF